MNEELSALDGALKKHGLSVAAVIREMAHRHHGIDHKDMEVKPDPAQTSRPVMTEVRPLPLPEAKPDEKKPEDDKK